MNDSRFLKRLRDELPDWQARGWVTPENSEAILDHLEPHETQSNLFTNALAILGVLLLGSGVITWFAANWSEMSKLAKLIVLFGSLYAAYGAAGTLITRDKAPKVGQAFILLGVILFGANIMLIAQIYHIDSHYPNGVMLWALGGLLTAYLLKSQAAHIAAVSLAVLWTWMESFNFNAIHVEFLLFWVACLPAIYLWHWRTALHVTLIAILFWSFFVWFVVSDIWGSGALLYIVQVYFVAYLSAFVAGMLLDTHKRLSAFAKPVQNYSVIATLFSLYLLTFPDLQTGYRDYTSSFRVVAEESWIISTVITLLVLLGLTVWHRQKVFIKEKPRYLVYAQLLIAFTIGLIFLNLFVSGVHGSWIALAFNIIFFGGMVWLVFAGMYTDNRFLVNIAFFFFAQGLITRYFDTFWTLLNRSYFFMFGGVLLILGGYLLEKQRRRITTQIEKGRQAEAGA